MTGTAARAAQLQREGQTLPQIAMTLGVSETYAGMLLREAAAESPNAHWAFKRDTAATS